MDNEILLFIGAVTTALTVLFNWRRDVTNQLRADYDRVLNERNALQLLVEQERVEHAKQIETLKNEHETDARRQAEQFEALRKRLAERDEVIVNQSVRLAGQIRNAENPS